ncbi:hypothetical protein ES703_11033 [subsurface metagenome]
MNDYRLKKRKYNEKSKGIYLRVPESKADNLKDFFYEILNFVRNQGTDKVLRNYYNLNLNKLLQTDLSESDLEKLKLILIDFLEIVDKRDIDIVKKWWDDIKFYNPDEVEAKYYEK